MQNIIAFFIRNRNFFFYIALLSLALIFTFQSHSYHKSKFINSANAVTGGIYGTLNNITTYFDLKEQNKLLAEENKELRNMLFSSGKEQPNKIVSDSSSAVFKYKIRTASVIKNSYAKTKNYLTINKGSKDSVAQDFGVISSTGIVGIIENTSRNYATVQSVLNALSRINAQIKNTSQFGTLKWDAKDYKIVQLIDIPDIAPIQKGDTIITGGMSTIFPKGIPIGTISDFKLDASENYYIVDVALFTNMTNLEHVYVIENINAQEIKSLEETVNEQ